MSGITVSPRIRPLTQVARYVRNGKIPDAQFQSELVDLANSAAAYRGKELFRSIGSIAGIPSSGGAGERKRHRFAFHAGPYCDKVVALFVFAAQDHGGTANAYGQLLITTTAGATVGTAGKRYNPFYLPSGTLDVPDNFSTGFATVDVSPDTDYYGYVSDFDQARIVSVVVYEMLTKPDSTAGYIVPSVSGNGPIFSSDRSALMLMADSIYRRGASQTFTWHSDEDGSARTSGPIGDRNLVDDTSTTVSASTPGFTLDFTGKASFGAAATGVSCSIAVYGVRTGAAGNQGIKVKDSSGTTLVTLNAAPLAAGWFTGTVVFPATKAKYDLQYFVVAGTLTVYAVSIYEYLT